MTDVRQIEWATAQVRNWGNRLASILDLHSAAVGVRFVAADQPALERATVLKRVRYCHGLAEAGRGGHLLLSAGEMACRRAATLFGFRPQRAGLQSGKRPEGFGMALGGAAGRRMLEGMPRLNPGTLQHLHLFPLTEAECLPDIIVVEGNVEALMRIAPPYPSPAGDRWMQKPSAAGPQATCVKTTLIPFLERRLSFCPGCYGCRDATGVCGHQPVVGFPLFRLRSIVEDLACLDPKAMPGSCSERTRQALKKRGGP